MTGAQIGAGAGRLVCWRVEVEEKQEEEEQEEYEDGDMFRC